MRRLRYAAFVVLAGGIALGTWTDTPAPRAPIEAGGYDVLSGDFHVHTFVGDGGLAPWTLQEHAARVGLDVIAITNHNQTFAGRLGRWAARRSSGPLVLVGEEVSGRDFHLVAVGIERPVNWDQPARQAIADVHAQGGIAIAAHPASGFGDGYDEIALAELDGVEAAYSDRLPPAVQRQFAEFYQRTLTRNPEVAAIGSSDFHTDGPMGGCRTFLFVRERTESAVVAAIAEGRTVGFCETIPPGQGSFRGRRELVRLLEPHRAALAPPRESAGQVVAMMMVWVSLLALALVGPRS
jgi:hypothetical protein